MAKTVLTHDNLQTLRVALLAATLEAYLASRRWQPGEMVFQGGTSLHLAYRSMRWSEDLDFLVDQSLDLGFLENALRSRITRLDGMPAGGVLSVSKSRDDKSPHTLFVTASSPQWIGSAHVKLELWQTPPEAMQALSMRVLPLWTEGRTLHAPVLHPQEIYADKVFALAARPYLKPRDVFDLQFLQAHPEVTRGVNTQDLLTRLRIYPNEEAGQWIEKAEQRAATLPGQTEAIRKDLQRWLPSFWNPSNDDMVQMVECSVNALMDGAAVMRAMQPPGAPPKRALGLG
jgi:predicted nucleotidyltransferase component of viral defense system